MQLKIDTPKAGSILHGWEAASLRNPSALAATRVKHLTCHPAMGSGNVCPTEQLVSWSDILNSCFCTIFERCYATCYIKGEAEGKEANTCWIFLRWGGFSHRTLTLGAIPAFEMLPGHCVCMSVCPSVSCPPGTAGSGGMCVGL